MITRSYQISAADYKKAQEQGAESIIARSENPIDARVAEVAPGAYLLAYEVEEGPLGYCPWQE